MSKLAIVGGTGLTSLDGLTIQGREMVRTPYGSPSGPLTHGELFGHPVTFLARHGHKHTIPPHRVNYRANLWALKSVGIEAVFAVGAVGGIAADCAPEVIVIPDQIIDYTYGRDHTFYDEETESLQHIGFSFPFSEPLRQRLIAAAGCAGVQFLDKGVFGITQGPRLETAAEIQRLHRDGCSIVGMTAMPEAALARELALEYASITMVVNWAAGLEPAEIDFKQVQVHVANGVASVRRVFSEVFANWDACD